MMTGIIIENYFFNWKKTTCIFEIYIVTYWYFRTHDHKLSSLITHIDYLTVCVCLESSMVWLDDQLRISQG